ncbi:MAG: VOC family protein, partial [Planctomycetota bacterium]
SHRHHSINYHELAVADLAAAKHFYASAFGWTFNDYGPDYAGIRDGGDIEVGGIRQEPGSEQAAPLLVLYSADLEASLAAVQAAGGRIVKEPFSFPGGRRFHFTDLAGNELAVWSDR